MAQIPPGLPDGGGGARTRLAAASELKPVTRLQYMSFIGLAVVIQSSWGLFNVCSRYMQVRGAVAAQDVSA